MFLSGEGVWLECGKFSAPWEAGSQDGRKEVRETGKDKHLQ